MKKPLLILLFVSISITNFGQIIADHTVVGKFEDIPQQYIDEVKKIWLVVAGESHSAGYRAGLTLLGQSYPAYAVSVVESGSPELYTIANLRASRATWGDVNNTTGWIYDYGEEDWWTSSTSLSRTKAGITFCNTNNLQIGALGFGWCWDPSGGGPSFGVDPVYGVHWYGWSEGSGHYSWGLDDEDNSLTSNTVNMDTYLRATQEYIDYCTSNGYPTKVFFTTGPVDNWEGDIPDEAMYQQHLKYEHIREYVRANSSRILFDYADILCYDNDGTPTTVTWNGHEYPRITSTNLLPTVPSYHISEQGALRLAKAMWWMLARMAGWDGSTGNILVESIAISGAGGSSVIYTDNGQLQLMATVSPTNATNQSVTWSISSGAMLATINATGLVTAVDNGTVTIRATSTDGSNIFVELNITISNQTVPVSVSITSSATEVVSGGQVTFTATPTNGGSSPVYQWKVDNINTGTNSSTFIYSPLASGVVTCVLTSDFPGATGNPARSNAIAITVLDSPIGNNTIEYINSVQGTVCATAPEGGNAVLTAPSGAVFTSVDFASYGTPAGTCPDFTLGSCHALTSQSVAADYLLGNNSGTIPATNSIFGDPCVDTAKRLYISATYSSSLGGGTIHGSVPTGGTGVYTYLWESSTIGAGSGFSLASGTNNANDYMPVDLTQTTWFRRTVTSGSISNISTAIIVNIISDFPVTGITVAGTPTIIADNGTSQLTATISPANATIQTVTWSITNGTGSATISTEGLVTALTNGTVTVRATANDGTGIYSELVIVISNQVIPVTGITVTGTPTIVTDNGTTQLAATISPTNVTIQTVAWSLLNGTGTATISTAGLVTALTNGTVTARATANDGTGIYGEMVITITNQLTPVSVSITSSATEVVSGGQVTFTATPTNGGSSPVYQWKVDNINTGTNSSTFIYSPLASGVVTCVLTSDFPGATGNPARSNAIAITVLDSPIGNNTIEYINSVQGTVCATAPEGGNAVLTAPSGAVFTSVDFASYGTPAGTCPDFTLGSCHALTSQSVAADYLLGNNSGTIPATNSIFGDPCVDTAKRLYISATYSSSLGGGTIHGSVPTGGTGVYTYLWESSTIGAGSGFSLASGTNNANDYMPVDLTQTTWFRRTVTSGSISNISTAIIVNIISDFPVTGITVAGTPTIIADNGTSQLTATISPANATIQTVTWSITNGTGSATISTEGLVTALTNGTVTVRATANDGTGIYSELVIVISNQVIPVTGITVTGTPTIVTDNGTTQLAATISPTNVTIQTVAWSLLNGTGTATISTAGLVTALTNGTVTARATANDGTGIYGEMVITITNQLTPVSVSITSSATEVVSGGQVTFTATPTNGGSSPVYQWKVDNINTGTNSSTFIYSPLASGVVTCVLTSDFPGATGNPARSNAIAITVLDSPIGNNTIEYINSVQGTVCATAPEGGNAVLTAPSGAVFTSVDFASYGTPAGTCPDFTLGSCHALTSQSVAADYLLGNNSGTIPATNSIFGDPCVDTAKRLYISATYSSSLGGGTIHGSVPTGGTGVYTYLWESSTIGVGSGFSPASGTNNANDYMPVDLTQTTWFRRTVTSGSLSNTSAALFVSIGSDLPVSVTISSSATEVVSGGQVTFTATPTNGGSSPVYQWKVDNINTGTNSSTFIYSPLASGVVTCVLTSDFPGATGNPARSNAIAITVLDSPIGNNTIEYINSVQGTVCATAPEGGNAVLTAPSGAVFTSVDFASYGTPAGTCPDFTLGSCHALTSQSVAADYLLGNNSGTIPATNSIFGDPCVDTAKRLYISATYSSSLGGGTIHGSVPTGGTGVYTYLWESSTIGAGSGFSLASGTNNANDYMPVDLTQTTWFRRTVTSGSLSNTSAAILVSTAAGIPKIENQGAIQNNLIPDTFSSEMIKGLVGNSGFNQSEEKYDNFVESNINIYPLPSTGHFTVSIKSGNEKLIDIYVLSLTGNIVLVKKNVIIKGNAEISFDLSIYTAGIYYLKFVNGNISVIKKIILSR